MRDIKTRHLNHVNRSAVAETINEMKVIDQLGKIVKPEEL